MAVDANVLIYERIREEIRAGRAPVIARSTPATARAFGTILDSNLTTLIIAACFLYRASAPARSRASPSR